MMAFTSPAKKITIWLIGDSTMSIKKVSAYPETGWGMPFAYFWDSTITVDNRAMNGRSTRTFIEENRWASVTDALKEGDYVFVQFGHNDEVSTKVTYVNEVDFKKYLTKYVVDIKAKKAIPVLVTPVTRRRFDSTGHITETHRAYSTIVREVAAANNAVLFDLDEQSRQLLQQMGAENSKLLFNHLIAGEHPNYPSGKTDDTHFNELGARKIAELILNDVREKIPALAAHVVVGTK